MDDEPDVVTTLQDLLAAGLPAVTVLGAHSAAEALMVLRDVVPDMVIADYRMPGMDGVAVLAEARRRAPGAARVLMTAYPDATVAIQGINEAAIDHFAPKPWDAGRLVARLADLLREARALRFREQALERAAESVRRLAALEPEESERP